MHPDLIDPIEARLRAARPEAADVDPHAFDADLLARVTSQGAAARSYGRRAGRLAMPAAGLVAAAIAVVIVLAGNPSTTHAPRPDTAAAAIRRAALWFALPPGRILHYRSVMTSDRANGQPGLTQERWQSTDDPDRTRYTSTADGVTVDQAGGGLYDPQRNTIYAYVAPSLEEMVARFRHAVGAKIHAARLRRAGTTVIDRLRADRAKAIRQLEAGGATDKGPGVPLGDPNVERVHHAFESGHATAGAPTHRDGIAARPITLTIGDASVRWVLWAAIDDGRPLALVIDHGPGTQAEETTVYETYELLPATDAHRLLTLRGAHPGAHVVRSSAAYRTAQARLFPNG